MGQNNSSSQANPVDPVDPAPRPALGRQFGWGAVAGSFATGMVGLNPLVVAMACFGAVVLAASAPRDDSVATWVLAKLKAIQKP